MPENFTLDKCGEVVFTKVFKYDIFISIRGVFSHRAKNMRNNPSTQIRKKFQSNKNQRTSEGRNKWQ